MRAGLIRPLAAGIFSYLPLGFRVKQKIEQILREEMLAIDCAEIVMPVVHPSDIWEASGREANIKVSFRWRSYFTDQTMTVVWYRPMAHELYPPQPLLAPESAWFPQIFIQITDFAQKTTVVGSWGRDNRRCPQR